MTVCIACLANKSKTLVVASDRMITAGFLAKQFEHEGSKIYNVAPKIVALTAGEATRYLEIFRKTKPKIEQNQSLSVREAVNILKEEYEVLRNEKINEIYFRPMGMTRETFYGEYIRRIPEDLAMALDKLVHAFNLEIEIIVAGVDEDGGHIFGIRDPGTSECFDSIGYHSIGIGQSHALLSLISNNASPNDDIPHTIYNVYEAKKMAENTPGVGKITDISIITDTNVKALTQADIAILQSAFDKINKPRKANILKLLKDLNLN